MGALLKGHLPGILFIDDIQWADTGTLDLLSYLARRIQTTGCFIIVAWRSDSGPQTERFYQLMADLQRAGCAVAVHLDRLNLEEIRQLASSLEASLPARLIDRLYQESEGLPFIAIEYLRSLHTIETGWKLPDGVINLLHQRLQAPGETARQLLAAAAVIGRSFDFNTLQAVSGRSEWETVAGLEELVGLGLVREQGPQRFDFNHDKLRAVAYEETSATRRSLLHRRAAEFIVASGQSEREAGAWAGLAANHFLQSGQADQAADYFWQAGWYARRLHANADALAAFQSALAAGHPDLAGLHEACGDLLVLRGEYRAAIHSYQSAAAVCKKDCLSNIMHKLGEIDHRLGEWQAAQAHYRAALDAAGEESDSAWRSHLFSDWSLTAFIAAEVEPATQLAQKALELAQHSSDASALAQAYNMLGILSRAEGEWEQAEGFLKRSLDTVSGIDDLSLRCAALHNLARLEQERDHFYEAIPLAREALEDCIRIGDRHHQAALLNMLADLHHAVGREAESMTYLKQAVTLFAEIGGDIGRDIPEIWKLTEW
jgi:predicted ATPase